MWVWHCSGMLGLLWVRDGRPPHFLHVRRSQGLQGVPPALRLLLATIAWADSLRRATIEPRGARRVRA